MARLVFTVPGGKSSSHPSQKRSAPRSFFFCLRVAFRGLLEAGAPPTQDPHHPGPLLPPPPHPPHREKRERLAKRRKTQGKKQGCTNRDPSPGEGGAEGAGEGQG